MGSDGEWAGSDADSEDEGRDRTFQPVYALWMEKGLIPRKNMRGGTRLTGRPAHLMGRGKGRKQVTFGLILDPQGHPNCRNP